jgi:hypothetical protein
MTPDDARKLLGGYATGTLTEEERQALFAAALEDQELFDALALEEPLRAALEAPAARATLLASLDERPRVWWRSWRAVAAVTAMAAVAVAVVVMRPKAPAPVTVARVEAPPAPPVVSRPAPPPPETRVVEDKKRVQAKRKAVEAAPSARAPEAPVPVVVAEGPKGKDSKDVAPMVGAVGGFVAPAPPPPAASPMFESAGATDIRAETPRFRAMAAAQPSARALFLGGSQQQLRIQPTAAVAGTGAPQAVGIRYSVVRREGDSFAPADPNDLKQDDTLALRFTANTNGYLSVAGAAPIALTAMRPYTTSPLAADQAEARIVFSRTPQTTLTTAMAPLTEAAGAEVYVVNTTGAGALGFTIQLTRK